MRHVLALLVILAALFLAGSTNRAELGGSCCKVCESSCACGNSCISCSYECHQPPGCACDAGEGGCG